MSFPQPSPARLREEAREVQRRERQKLRADRLADAVVGFKPLSQAALDRLLAKGVEDAKALDRAIRDQFTLGPEAGLRLR
jgi:hypothetical protein